MKAFIGRDTDGWGTRGLVARLEDGRVLTAAEAAGLVQHLRGVGVNQIEMSDDHGDRALSEALRQSVLDAWDQSESPTA